MDRCLLHAHCSNICFVVSDTRVKEFGVRNRRQCLKQYSILCKVSHGQLICISWVPKLKLSSPRARFVVYREQCIRFRVKKSDHLPDEVQTEIESFHSMLEASVIAAQLQDVRMSEGGQYLLYMRNLPGKVQEFLQLHQNATTVQQLFLVYIRTRVQGDMGSIHVTQLVGKAQPTKPGGRGKGRGKGGRKTKGRGKGNKFRGVDGEEEQDDQRI